MNDTGYPKLVITTNKLKGRSHFTLDRFISMFVKNCVNHDRIIIEANDKTLNIAVQISYLFKEAFMMEEKRDVIIKTVGDIKVKIYIFILEKIPAIRRN